MIEVRKKRLGELLLEEGRIQEQQLSRCIEESRKLNIKLGQYIIKKGYMGEQELLEVLSRKLGLIIYDPDVHQPADDAASLLPGEMALAFNAVPLYKQGSLLTAVFIDPTDIAALDQVERASDLEVNPLLCTYRQFYKLYSTLYKHDPYQNILSPPEDEEDPLDEPDFSTQPGDQTTDIDENALRHMVDDAPVIRLVNSLLSIAVNEKASDIHISPKQDRVQVRLRVDGKLHEVDSPPKRMFLPIVSRIKILAGLDISVRRIPQDGRFTIMMQNKEINIRVSCIPTSYGEKVVMRLLDMDGGVRSLESLGMSARMIKKVRRATALPYGMYLSTGPTGSGKSTTLYAIIKEVASTDINIVTLEDPIEYRIDNVEQVQLNTKAGMTFASGLRSILRQDPDVIMVGEIRDRETAEIATNAALTGHKLLSTVHTNDAAGAVVRFLDMDIEPFLIASMLSLVIGQRLMRRICPHCKEPLQPSKALLRQFGAKRLERLNLHQGKGCYHCLYTGYQGRVGAFETLLADGAVRELIQKRASSDAIVEAARESQEFTTMQEHALDLVRMGLTSLEEFLRVFPADMQNGTRKNGTHGKESMPAGNTTEPQQPALRPSRILVVDDDEDMQMFLKTVLDEAFYEVHLASEAKSAMEKIFEISPDLIIVDYYMPEMDGVTLIERFKSQPGANGVRTIMLTASEMDETEIRSLEVGADDWLHKPVSPERLLARVKRLLR